MKISVGPSSPNSLGGWTGGGGGKPSLGGWTGGGGGRSGGGGGKSMGAPFFYTSLYKHTRPQTFLGTPFAGSWRQSITRK